MLDGHNRYKLCEKHTIDYRVRWLMFGSREEARAWVLSHQLGRRNLTDDQRALTALHLQEERSAIEVTKRAKKAGESGGRGREHEAKNDDSLEAHCASKLSNGDAIAVVVRTERTRAAVAKEANADACRRCGQIGRTCC